MTAPYSLLSWLFLLLLPTGTALFLLSVVVFHLVTGWREKPLGMMDPHW